MNFINNENKTDDSCTKTFDLTRLGNIESGKISLNEKMIKELKSDELKPKELLNRLNYIHYATANPKKPINYNDYKTHADKLINHDKTKLSTNDKKLLPYLKAYYPQLTENHIDARDCLNEGSNKNSCFQNPSFAESVIDKC